jgi:hypothetical protein
MEVEDKESMSDNMSDDRSNNSTRFIQNNLKIKQPDL